MQKNAITIKRALLIFTIIIFVLACIAGCSATAGARKTEGDAESNFRKKMADASVTKIAVKKDLVLESPVEIKGTKVLYGKGSITAVGDAWAGDDYMIVVPSGAQLTVKGSVSINADGITGGVHAAQGAVWCIEETASVNNASAKAANTLVEGVFCMNGGTMSGAMGHNVYNLGEVTISEGEIIGSGTKCAGIYNEGTLTQDGGTIRNAYNNVTVLSGSFGFHGGNNQDSVRDGIYVAEGAKLSVTAKSAAITGSGVRGIYLCGEAAIDNVTLSSSGDSLVKISQTGILNLNGGTLVDSGYHTVENAGKMVMTGGSIRNSYNCGIVNTGELEITGGSFLDNVNNKAVLNKHNGRATISGKTVMFSGNRFAVANEDTATLDMSGAEILLTTVTNVYAYDGQVNIYDISLGAAGSNNVRIYKAEVTMNNVEVLGNSSSGSSTTHGILLEGGVLNATDVTIKNTTGYGIRNKGGEVVAENLLISKSSMAGGINNTLQDHTGVPGVMTVNNLTIEDIRYNNIVVDGGTLTVNTGELKASGTNNTKITDGTLQLKDVAIHGNLPDVDGTNHAVYSTGGTLVAENVKIKDAKVTGLRVNGQTAVISGRNVTIENSPKYGIDLSAGMINIDGLTMAGNHYNITTNGGSIKLRNSNLGPTVSNNVRINESGSVDLQNVVIKGHTPDHTKNVHALFLDNGKLTGEKITVQNVSDVGLRVKGGTANIRGLTVEDAGADGVWIDGGKATIYDLVIKKAGSAGISATNTGDIVVIGGSINNTVSHGAKSEGDAKLTLEDISVAIATTDGRHAVLAQGGDVQLNDVTITGLENNTTGFGIRINRDTSHVTGKGVHISDVNTGISATAGSADISGVTTQNMAAHSVYAATTAKLEISDSTFGVSKTNNAKSELGGVITLNHVVIEGTQTNHGLMVENGGYLYGKDITVRNTAGCAVRVKCGSAGNYVEIDGLVTENIGTSNIHMNKDAQADNVGGIVIQNANLCRTKQNNVRADAGDLTLVNTTIQGHLPGTTNSSHAIYVCDKVNNVNLDGVEVLDSAGDALRVANGKVVATDFVSQKTGRYGTWVDGGSLTAKNMTLSGSAEVGIHVSAKGSVVIDGVNVSGSGTNNIKVVDEAQLTVNGYADGSKSQISTCEEDNVRAEKQGVIRLNNVEVWKTSKNNVVAIDGGTVYMTDSAVTGGNHSVLADKNGKVYLNKVSIAASVTSGIRANHTGSLVEATDVVIDGANTGLSIKCGTVQISNITVANTKAVGVAVQQGDADATVTLNNLVTENCGTNAIYTSGANAKLTVNGATLSNDGSDHVIYLNGGPMALHDVAVKATLAADRYELYSGAGWLTIGGEIDANILIATAPGRVIKVDKTLTGNNLVVDWQNAPTGNALEFTDADMLDASKESIVLGSIQGASSVLKYEGKAATLETLEIYTTVNSWNELKTLVSTMTSGSYMEYRIAGNASDWKADATLAIPEGVQVMLSADENAPAIEVASGVSPFTLEANTALTLENLFVGGTASAKAAHIIVPKTATLTLNNTTLQYFEGERGSAVHVNCGTLTADGSTFANNSNSTNWGGAVGIWGGTVDISNSLFTGNTSKYSGGAIINYKADGGSFGGTTDNTVGDLSLTNCVFTNNSTQEHGGAVASWANGTTTITGCVFGDENDAAKGNSVTKNGGAIHVQDGHKMTVTNCKFFYNSTATNANTFGGALYAKSSVQVQVSGCTFKNNFSKYGGAINVEDNAGGGMSIDQCVFEDNKAQVSGGEAGAVRIAVATSVTNCTFEGNAATGNGGAILVVKASTDSNNVVLRGTTFTGNSGAQGGAISVATGCTVALHDIVCENNKTTGALGSNTTWGYGDIRIADNTSAGEVKISGKIVASFWNNQAHAVKVVGALTEGSNVTIDWRLGKLSANKIGLVFGSQEIMNASKGFIQLGVDASATEGWEFRYSTTSPWQATLVKE